MICPSAAAAGRAYAERVQVPAFRSAGIRWLALSVAVLVLAADQLTKALALAIRPRPGTGLVSVRLVRNTGASFDLGAAHPVLVMLVSVLLIAVVAVMLARTSSRLVAVFLALVLGGALGNVSDRMFRSPGLGRGAVVDWIHVQGYPATFNLADLAIRAGAVGVVVVLLGRTRHRAMRQPSQ